MRLGFQGLGGRDQANCNRQHSTTRISRRPECRAFMATGPQSYAKVSRLELQFGAASLGIFALPISQASGTAYPNSRHRRGPSRVCTVGLGPKASEECPRSQRLQLRCCNHMTTSTATITIATTAAAAIAAAMPAEATSTIIEVINCKMVSAHQDEKDARTQEQANLCHPLKRPVRCTANWGTRPSLHVSILGAGFSVWCNAS